MNRIMRKSLSATLSKLDGVKLEIEELHEQACDAMGDERRAVSKYEQDSFVSALSRAASALYDVEEELRKVAKERRTGRAKRRPTRRRTRMWPNRQTR
jgi:hypothetical protein